MVQLAWLNGMMKQPEEAARRDFALVPEFVLRDLAAWLSFVVRMGQAILLGSMPMGLVVDTITGLLQAPHLVRSAVVQFRLVELLQAMLAPQLRGSGRPQGKPSCSVLLVACDTWIARASL